MFGSFRFIGKLSYIHEKVRERETEIATDEGAKSGRYTHAHKTQTHTDTHRHTQTHTDTHKHTEKQNKQCRLYQLASIHPFGTAMSKPCWNERSM